MASSVPLSSKQCSIWCENSRVTINTFNLRTIARNYVCFSHGIKEIRWWETKDRNTIDERNAENRNWMNWWTDGSNEIEWKEIVKNCNIIRSANIHSLIHSPTHALSSSSDMMSLRTFHKLKCFIRYRFCAIFFSSFLHWRRKHHEIALFLKMYLSSLQ